VQHDINDILHLGLSEDGQFGPATQAAVKTFQANWGLQQDGIVGPQTGNYLFYYGDSYYNGTANGYCYSHLPTTW
jgi:peptidoglycan hydrolase-like protein with peptidoglycan-binding domain